MILFQYINQNINHVKTNVALGLFPCSILRHYEIYARFDYYKKAGYDQSKAFTFILFDYNLNERTLYRILKRMETIV